MFYGCAFSRSNLLSLQITSSVQEKENLFTFLQHQTGLISLEKRSKWFEVHWFLPFPHVKSTVAGPGRRLHRHWELVELPATGSWWNSQLASPNGDEMSMVSWNVFGTEMSKTQEAWPHQWQQHQQRFAATGINGSNKNWLVVYLPLWKIWVRQLGWWHSQLHGKIKVMFQSPSIREAGEFRVSFYCSTARLQTTRLVGRSQVKWTGGWSKP